MSRLEYILQRFRNNRGFKINDFPEGTKVSVNTTNSLYELVVLDEQYVSIFGGIKKDGSTRFPKPTKAIVFGATLGGSIIRLNWIVYSMQMEIRIEEGENHGHTIVTSAVKNAIIESKDKSWRQSIDWE